MQFCTLTCLSVCLLAWLYLLCWLPDLLPVSHWLKTGRKSLILQLLLEVGTLFCTQKWSKSGGIRVPTLKTNVARFARNVVKWDIFGDFHTFAAVFPLIDILSQNWKLPWFVHDDFNVHPSEAFSCSPFHIPVQSQKMNLNFCIKSSCKNGEIWIFAPKIT